MVDRDMVNYYETLSAMKDRNFSVLELERMFPYEFDFYVMLEEEKIKEEKLRIQTSN